MEATNAAGAVLVRTVTAQPGGMSSSRLTLILPACACVCACACEFVRAQSPWVMRKVTLTLGQRKLLEAGCASSHEGTWELKRSLRNQDYVAIKVP